MDNSIDIIPAGLVLKDKEAHAIELIASGSDVHFAEIMSGLRSGSINAAGAKAREAHNTGRKVSDFGKALLALKAAPMPVSPDRRFSGDCRRSSRCFPSRCPRLRL